MMYAAGAMGHEDSHAELEIPVSARERRFQVLWTALVVGFTVLAFWNLINQVGVVASSIWMVMVALGFWSAWSGEGGIRKWWIDYLGGFAAKKFVQVIPVEGGRSDLRFGFWFGGRRWFEARIGVDTIAAIDWRMGQASSLAKRDMNDWHVALWFDPDDAEESEKPTKSNPNPASGIYIVGPSQAKEPTQTFAMDLVNLVRRAGAALERGQDSCSFVRRT